MSRHPPEAEQWLHRGLELAEQGQSREAWDAYSRALTIDATFAAAHRQRGVLLMNSQHWEQALAELARAAQLDPRDVDCLVWKAEVLGKLGRDREALADFQRAQQLDPRNGEAWQRRGLFHSDREDWQTALEDWRRAHELTPERPRPAHLVGRALCELGRHEEAEDYLDRAIELGEREPQVFCWRGVCRQHRGEMRAALADFHAACQMNPHSLMALAGRATCYIELGELRQAFDDLTRSIQIGGDGVAPRLERGRLFANARRFHEAWEDFEAALKFDPRDMAVRRERALLLESTGHGERADWEWRALDQLAYDRVNQLSAYSRRLPAAVLQANYTLLEPGPADAFCFVLFTFEDDWNRQPERLQVLAGILKIVKGTTPRDPHMRMIAEMISDERARPYRRRRLPDSVTEGAAIYYADLLVYRRFLPERQLRPGALVTIMAEPAEGGRIELAPPP